MNGFKCMCGMLTKPSDGILGPSKSKIVVGSVTIEQCWRCHNASVWSSSMVSVLLLKPSILSANVSC